MADKSASLSGYALLLLIFALTWQTEEVGGANILGVFTSNSPSHLIVHMSIVKPLAEKGHNVTVVSVLKPKVNHKNITNIIIPLSVEREKEFNSIMSEMSEEENNMWNKIKMILTSMTLMMDMQFEVMKDKRFTTLYDQPDTKFDLVIFGFFFNDFGLGVGAKLNAPIIVDWTSNPMDFTNAYIGNPAERSYVPFKNVVVEPGKQMTFGQRTQSFLGGFMFEILGSILNHRWNNYYKQLFPSENFPSYDDIKKNVSLVFCNSHFTEGPIRPNVPAMVEIGGIQVKEKPDPLPKNIQDHLDAGLKHGAILFCLGSNIKSSHVNPETVTTIFKVLSGLKQNVIWKWDDFSNLPGNSSNILYIKWLPQDDILAHPNIKLFITHAGKGGIAEAQYHAVPMVALPIFADQNENADLMVLSGFGLQVSMRKLTEIDLKNAVNEVLTNSTYKNKVKKFSNLYRDRPMSAKESVVYWTEYILRHRGAAHMQSPLVHMNRIQELNVDVVGAILGVLFIVFWILTIIVKFLYFKLIKKTFNSIKDKKYKSQ